MGHIQKRERDGTVRWQARYRAPDGRERAKNFERKTDAESWLATQTADKARGDWTDPALGRITFAEWVAEWKRGLTGIRRTTRARKLSILDNHLLPRYGDTSIAGITTTDVKAMVADQLADGYAPATVRKHVFTLSGILGDAVAESRLGRNPCDGVNLPAEQSKPMRFLDASQVRTIAEVHRPHYRPLVYTAAWVGLRWGELAGLRLDKIDLIRQTITVNEQLTEVAGDLRYGPPKTKHGIRTVTCPSLLVELLGQHFATEPVQESRLAFPTPTGNAMRRSNFRKVWSRAVERAGWIEGHPLEGLTFHELRHTAAALSIAQGAHPLTIKERLGHSSITVTMDRYGHLFPAQDAALAESLDGAFRKSFEDDTEGGQVVGIRTS